MGETAQERFESLLNLHRGIVFKVAGTYRRNPEDARDLAQEILVQLWKAFPRYDPSRPFSTWMYRVALNTAISALRREGRRRTLPLDDSAAARDEPEPDERIEALRRFIDRLDDLNRALMLLHLDERPHREIAEVLGLTETNVATKLGRLKQKIADAIGNRE